MLSLLGNVDFARKKSVKVLEKVCEKFVNFVTDFEYEPWSTDMSKETGGEVDPAERLYDLHPPLAWPQGSHTASSLLHSPHPHCIHCFLAQPASFPTLLDVIFFCRAQVLPPILRPKLRLESNGGQ